MTNAHLIAAAALAATVASLASPASANPTPTGVWIDHTGRGAVEIVQCGANLCGKLVWLKDSKNKSACGTEILGNVKPMGPGVWDKGWIFDPEANSRYDVELKPVGADKLRVLGYMGSKFLSETMMWKRAPADLQLCGGATARTASAPAPVAAAPSAGSSDAGAPAPGPVAKAPVETAPPAVKSEPAPPAPAQAETPPAADEPEPAPRKTAKRRTAQRECRLDLPYIRVTYPCID